MGISATRNVDPHARTTKLRWCHACRRSFWVPANASNRLVCYRKACKKWMRRRKLKQNQAWNKAHSKGKTGRCLVCGDPIHPNGKWCHKPLCDQARKKAYREAVARWTAKRNAGVRPNIKWEGARGIEESPWHKAGECWRCHREFDFLMFGGLCPTCYSKVSSAHDCDVNPMPISDWSEL